RSWAVQLLAEDESVPESALIRFAEMARTDQSALVRLYLASALQRIKAEQRWDIVAALSRRAEDKDDHNIPLMVWYAAEPLVRLDVDRAMELAQQAELPNLLIYTIKAAGDIGTNE